MKYQNYILFICLVFAGCQIKSIKYLDAESVVKNITNKSINKNFAGMKIVSREPGGTLFYLEIDSLELSTSFRFIKGEIKFEDKEINDLRDKLEVKYHLDPKIYLERLKQKAVDLITVMLENGILWIHIGDITKSKNNLHLKLNNGDYIILCNVDDEYKNLLFERYTFIKVIDSAWYVMRDKK